MRGRRDYEEPRKEEEEEKTKEKGWSGMPRKGEEEERKER